MKPKDFLPPISVIVPVHNAATTLDACMESILMQDYPNLEILLIENESTDNSLKVCMKYSRQYDFVQLYPSDPKGVSHARNTGLRYAKGYYILFVDSDDTLEPGAIHHLTEAIYRHDLAIGHFNFALGSKSTKRGLVQGNISMNDQEFMEALIKNPGSFYYSVLWNKLYRSDIIIENDLSFDPFLSWGEDFAFNMQYYQHVKKVAFTNQAVYNYRKNLKGASISALKKPLHSCRIKYRLYRSLKTLYAVKGLEKKHRFRLYSYIGNVTINQ